jgi:hypothetical protein
VDFPDPDGPHQRHELARRNAQRHVVQHRGAVAAVAKGDVAQLQLARQIACACPALVHLGGGRQNRLHALVERKGGHHLRGHRQGGQRGRLELPERGVEGKELGGAEPRPGGEPGDGEEHQRHQRTVH